MASPIAPTSIFTTATPITADAQNTVRGISSDGSTPTSGVQTLTTTTQPVAGQPTSGQSAPAINSIDFNDSETDWYRNGDAFGNYEGGGDINELQNPLTLQGNGNPQPFTGDETLAFMALQIVPPQISGQTASSAQQIGQTIINNYARFFLQSVSEPEQEKYQVVETFTGFYAFFYGKRPPIYRFSGTLLNDTVYRWNNDMKYIYENFFRGTSATQLNAEVVINYDGRAVTGFPLNLVMQQEAMNDKGMPFSMDVLVINYSPLTLSQDVAGLLAQAKSARQQMINQVAAAQAMSAGAGGAGNIALQSTNGVIPTSGVYTVSGGIPTNAVNQITSAV